jgi:hypothetical protein
MATSVFTPCEGAVVRVNLCEGSGGTGGGTFNVTIDGAAISLPVTGFVHEMQGNYQFLHALDRFVYFYSFGDRIGEITVSGLSFAAAPCGPGAGVLKPPTICSLYDLYAEKKQSKIKKAVKIGASTCGSFQAFLTGMRLEVTAANSGVPIGQWSLRFHVIPPQDTTK